MIGPLHRHARRAQARLFGMIGCLAPVEIAFLGDSITQFWADEDPWLFRPGRVNRGRAGDTLPGMRDRFATDVAARHPRAVHLMGGINDLWYGRPGANAADALAAVHAITEAAAAHGIRVILAPPLPIGEAAEPLMAHAGLWRTLRDGIAAHAHDAGHILADYAPSLVDDAGRLRPAFTTDGIHLTHAGYRALRRPAEAAIAAALAA